jgi:hypothetical protein
MIELRLVSREGDYLVLESQAGERSRVLVDDSLRELTRIVAKPQSGTSPKDIQAAIRSGLTITEVAEQTGESVDFISLFAGAVLDELDFVLQAALSVMLSDGAEMVPFAQLVSRTHAIESWQVAKRDGRWVVTAKTESGIAEWAFSPSDLTIEPTNSLAKSTSTGAPAASATRFADSELLAGSDASQANQAATVEGERSASVLDLVSEIRRRDADSLRPQEPIEASDSQTDRDAAKPASAKGRASLPSWDEIVSGTSHPDEEF